MTTRHHLGRLTVEIDDEARTVTSIWPDSVELVAAPEYTDESVARAASLGYHPAMPGDGDALDCWAVWQMTRDHDLMHHLVAQAEGAPWSQHLRNVALSETKRFMELEPADGDREERIVMLMQRLSNVGVVGLTKDAT